MDYAHPDSSLWRHHPRPWRLVECWNKYPNGQPIAAILDAGERVVLTDFGLGFWVFWQRYKDGATT